MLLAASIKCLLLAEPSELGTFDYIVNRLSIGISSKNIEVLRDRHISLRLLEVVVSDESLGLDRGTGSVVLDVVQGRNPVTKTILAATYMTKTRLSVHGLVMGVISA
jgi:hypothetical protein